jgi:aryl-alcohol dehydrogenase-like predicted oxidoreductase
MPGRAPVQIDVSSWSSVSPAHDARDDIVLHEVSAVLERRSLGNGGPEITIVGFGAWAVGGGDWAFSWGPQDDEASIAAMRRAVELGINWIDTAAVYGLGHSEEVIGRFLKTLPQAERPLVFTKGGLIWDDNNRRRVAIRNSHPRLVRQGCEDSLRRLGVERIDLLQFHWPDESGTPVEDSWGEMGRLIDEGKIRYAGVSNYPVALLERCEQLRHVQSLQSPFSLIRPQLAETEIPWCQAHGTGVLCYSPMQAGLLTDSFSAARVSAMPEDDWRPRSPEFQEPNLSANLALRDALRPIAARHRTSVSAIAVAWVASWPGVTGAIVGARSAQQVDGWIDAARVKLTREDLDEIARASAAAAERKKRAS